MSYYPTESRGGCMESISRCCRQAYVYPVDARKLLYAAGGVLGVVLVAVIWSGFSSSSSESQPHTIKGSAALKLAPLVLGCNFFPSNLRDLGHNNVSSVSFDQDLQNSSVFGNATCKSCQTNLPRLESGLVSSQIWSINVPCQAQYKDSVSLTLEQVDAMTRLVERYPDKLKLITGSSQIKEAFDNKVLGNVLAVNSGHSMDGRLAVLRTLYRLGVRLMALTSSCSNPWASSFNDTNDKGLSDLGKVLVREMNRLGILIDLSEASHQTQLDVLNITKAPVVLTHSAAYGLITDTRNVKDDVLNKLKENNGLVMVTFAQKYLTNNSSNTTISSVVDHINYIKNRTGVANVGIGAEFDASGLLLPQTLRDPSKVPDLFDSLGSSWNQDDLKLLAGGNLVRVLQAVEKLAKYSVNLPADETFTLVLNSSCYSDYNTRYGNIPENKTETTTAPAPTTVVPATIQVATTAAPTTKDPVKTTIDHQATTKITPITSTQEATTKT